MAYNFRNRNILNSRGTYYESSSDDSHDSDPDFRTRRPQRRSNQNNDVIPPGGVARPGRPPRSRANGEEQRRGPTERHRKRNRANFARVTDIQVTKITLLSWLINLGIVESNELVFYVDAMSRNKLGSGKVNGEGIVCDCCLREITVAEFELHSGRETTKPFLHIVLARSQISLLEYQIAALGHKDEEERRKFNNIQPSSKFADRKDDVCVVCADGGDLICCEHCTLTFHKNCIFMEAVPQGDWLCSYCVCKYCGRDDDPLKKCMQCDKQYHSNCGGEKLNLMDHPSALFCEDSCRKIYDELHCTLGVRNDLHDGLSWTLLQRVDEPITSDANEEYKRIQCNSKIAVAYLLLNECFVSTIDRHTRANILQSIIYNRGSNFTRINYSGFYTVVLEKDDEMISVATIRVHGKKLAEMPYIGTRAEYRRLGMGRILENCIESALCAMKVEKLVIPSMDHLVSMWTEKYFFSRIDEDDLKDLSVYNTVMFPSPVVKLQKSFVMLPDLNMDPSKSDEDS